MPALSSLPSFKKKRFRNAADAVAYVREIYDANTAYLRDNCQRLADDKKIPKRVSANYPYVAINVDRENLQRDAIDRRTSYGFVSRGGRHEATLTRPDIYNRYYTEQLGLLVKHHKVPIEVGVSKTPIPVHFAYPEGFHIEGKLTQEKLRRMKIAFDLPNILHMRDTIKAAEKAYLSEKSPYPLSFFTAPRVDASLHRLRHYTGTNPGDFQNFVIYTNYNFYMGAFQAMATEILDGAADKHSPIGSDGQYTHFIEPGGYTIYNQNMARKPTGQRALQTPQMPAYHLARDDGNGISLVNIGVGPTNAENMAEHIAVLRPHAWIMLGHCAGLRDELELGDFILAQAYEGIKKDGIAIAEVMVALKGAVRELTNRSEDDVREIMRTGTVITTDKRNWEFKNKPIKLINKVRAIGLDMESGVLASVGLRYSVPSGSLLCVSDKPLSGETKLPGMASNFYKVQTQLHLRAGVRAMELLRENVEFLHSRKLAPAYGRAFL